MNKTILQILDPRTKMMMMLCLSSLSVLFARPIILLGILFLCLLLLFAGGTPIHTILPRIKPLFYLMLTLFVIQCAFVRSGEPLLCIGSLVFIAKDGLDMALSMILRLMILTFSAMLLASGETRDYLLALVHCKIPYEISFMIMAAIHFIPLLHRDAQDVFCAVQMRGEELKKIPVKRKLAITVSLLLPIVASALDRIRTMSIAMEARAFRAYPQRTYWRTLELKVVDKAILLLFPFCTIVVAILLK